MSDSHVVWVARVEEPCLTYPAAGCDCCSMVCIAGAVNLVESGGGIRLAFIDAARCTGCGLCIGVCPTDAISVHRLD